MGSNNMLILIYKRKIIIHWLLLSKSRLTTSIKGIQLHMPRLDKEVGTTVRGLQLNCMELLSFRIISVGINKLTTIK